MFAVFTEAGALLTTTTADLAVTDARYLRKNANDTVSAGIRWTWADAAANIRVDSGNILIKNDDDALFYGFGNQGSPPAHYWFDTGVA